MVEIKPKDMYQFLLAECRYGYTRNNHLMPGGAYHHVDEYLPELLKADKEMAINTAKQLVEECIEMELVQFADGIDDDNGNRNAALRFIERMFAFVNENSDIKNWKPYNYDSYEANVNLDVKPRYDIYEAEYTGYGKLADEKEFKLGKKINTEMISKNDLFMFLIKSEPLFNNAKSATYRKYEYKPDWKDYVESNSYLFREEYNKQVLIKYVFDDIKKAVIVKRGD